MFNFSGFKEPSPSISESNPFNDHPTLPVSDDSTCTKDQPAGIKPCRLSARIKNIKKEKEEYTKDELLLKSMLLKQSRSVKRSELQLSEDMRLYLPIVKVTKLTDRHLSAVLDDWKFLDHNRITDRIIFRCEIIAKRQKTPENDHNVLVQLTHPSGIRKKEWRIRSDVPVDGIMTVDVKSLSWHEKLLLSQHLVKR